MFVYGKPMKYSFVLAISRLFYPIVKNVLVTKRLLMRSLVYLHSGFATLLNRVDS